MCSHVFVDCPKGFKVEFIIERLRRLWLECEMMILIESSAKRLHIWRLLLFLLVLLWFLRRIILFEIFYFWNIPNNTITVIYILHLILFLVSIFHWYFLHLLHGIPLLQIVAFCNCLHILIRQLNVNAG